MNEREKLFISTAKHNWKLCMRLSKISPQKLCRSVVKILALILSKRKKIQKSTNKLRFGSFLTMYDTKWSSFEF